MSDGGEYVSNAKKDAARRLQFNMRCHQLFRIGMLAGLTLGGIHPVAAEPDFIDQFSAEYTAGSAIKDAKPEAIGPGPLFAVVSIADQRISVYGSGGLLARSSVSTGMRGHATPTGIFSIIGKERYHESNIYSGAPMPLMQRITWSGIALHQGVVPGHPASHGCIRLPGRFAQRLYSSTTMGQRIIIAPSDTAPFEITHKTLPVPKLSPNPAPTVSSVPATPDATASVDSPAEGGDAVLEPVSLETAPANPERLNPLEMARAMRVEANRKAKAAGEATRTAMSLISKKTAEMRVIARKFRVAENAADDAKSELAGAERRLAKTDGKEAIAEAIEAKNEAEAALIEAQNTSVARIAKATEASVEAEAALAEPQRVVSEARAAIAEAQKLAKDARAASTEAQKLAGETRKAAAEARSAAVSAQKGAASAKTAVADAQKAATAARVAAAEAQTAAAEAQKSVADALPSTTDAPKPVAEVSDVATEVKTEAQASVMDAPKSETASPATPAESEASTELALAEAHKAAAEAESRAVEARKATAEAEARAAAAAEAETRAAEAHKASAEAEARAADAQRAMLEAQARAGAASDAEAAAAEAQKAMADAEMRSAEAETRAAAANKALREAESTQKSAENRLAKAIQAKADAEEGLIATKQAEERRVARATEAKSEAEAAIVEAQQGEERRIAKATDDKAKAETALAEAQKMLASAREVRDAMQQEVTAARNAVAEAKAAGKAAGQALAESARRLKPLSVFISRKTGRLYARQDFTPIFDAPITIRDPDRDIGTHVFISTHTAEDGEQLRWQAVSMPVPTETRASRKNRDRDSDDDANSDAAAVAPEQPETAQGALDRITVPEEISQRLSELAWVGSTVILSDYGISGETGPTTDFIILTRSRPSTR